MGAGSGIEMTSDFKWAMEPGHSVEYLYESGYPDLFKDQDVLYFQTAEELKACLSQLEQDLEGAIHVFKDYGKRPLRHWWQRLFRVADWHRVESFTLFWYSQYAALTFYDEHSSEYHAIDQHPARDVPTEIRLKLEEPTPAPSEECMQKTRAFAAAREFIDTGKRPEWLSYRYVR
jgi:hypothetical protein